MVQNNNYNKRYQTFFSNSRTQHQRASTLSGGQPEQFASSLGSIGAFRATSNCFELLFFSMDDNPEPFSMGLRLSLESFLYLYFRGDRSRWAAASVFQ